MKKVLTYIFAAFIFLSCDTETSSEESKYTTHIEVKNQEELYNIMTSKWYGKSIKDFAAVYGNYNAKRPNMYSGAPEVHYNDIVKTANVAGKSAYFSLVIELDDDGNIVKVRKCCESTISTRSPED
tara:strand:- start:73 stop:450 length:378 start_codon:yes stop_codon:yes gene_type:complete